MYRPIQIRSKRRHSLPIDNIIRCCVIAFGLAFSCLLFTGSTSAETKQSSFSCANVTEIPQSECEALVVLYNETDGPNWDDNTGWLVTDMPCSWRGVECLSGRVTELGSPSSSSSSYLSGLLGDLPVEISNLNNLRKLYLGNNQLSTIPVEIGNLVRLRELYLNDNWLSTIPAEIGNLTKLTTLDLRSNQLSDMPSTIINLINLSSFDLRYNRIVVTNSTTADFINSKNSVWQNTQTVAPSGLNASGFSTNVIQLMWTPINTSNHGYYEISYALSADGPYTVHGTTASKSGDHYLITGLAPNTTYHMRIRTYTFDKSNEHWSDYSDIVSAMPLAPTLFDCTAVSQIPQLECEALVALYNETGGPNWRNTTGWLETNTPCSWFGVGCGGGHITALHLSGNALASFGLQGDLPNEITNLVNLSKIDFSYNELRSLPAEIGNLANLAEIFLDSNELSSLPAGIGNLSKLKSLYIWGNRLKDLPIEILNLSNSLERPISHNRLALSDDRLVAFLDEHDPDWADTQTVAPTDMNATPTNQGNIELTWTPMRTGAYYEISIADGDSDTFTVHGTTTNVRASNYTIDGLSSNTTYNIRIRAYTIANIIHPDGLWSCYSEIVSATTAPDPTVTITATPTPTNTPTDTVTPTPTNTPTSTDIATPTPTNTPTTTLTSKAPDIRVTPAALSVTLPEGQSTTVPLTIDNIGDADLAFQISKQDSGLVQAANIKPQAQSATKVDPALLDALAENEQADFMIYLKKQANLDDASQIVDRAKRRQQVYETLRNTAQDTQADLLAWLDKQQVAGHVTDYRSFFLINAIGVTADRAAVDALAQRDDVAYLELEPTFTIPEPEESEQVSAAAAQGIEPGLQKIKANEVWSTLGIRGNGITVGIIDTGVEHTHPALKAQYRGTATGNHNFNWYDATGRFPNSPGDVGGHGTHVAGTIVGSDGGQNQIGVAPGAQWIAARACNPSEQGGCTSFDLLNALQWMLAPCPIGVEPGDRNRCDPSKSPDIVSNSWGSSGGGERGYETIVNNLRKAGIMPIFAAGNDGEYGDSTISSPGDYASSIAVGAVDGASRRARFSSQGPSNLNSKIKPDISAPGVDIRSAGLNGTYAVESGTSMATPHLAGVVALMLDANPKLTLEQIEMILKNTATDLGEAGPDYQYGYGLVNAFAAVQAATNEQPWLAYQPGQGTIEPDKSRKINVTLNAAGLAPGAHTMDLVITSNDPNTPRLTVPVTLMVEKAPPGEVAVQISNQTAKSATITWITNRPTTAEIHYGTSRQNLNKIEQDVRGQNQPIEDDVHYVTLKNLKPETKYYYQIREAGQSGNSENTIHNLTTGPEFGPGSPKAIYGKVLKDDETPAQHVIVLLQVVNADSNGSAGESAFLAGLTDGNGFWVNPDPEGALNLNSLRTADGKSQFYYTAGDKVDVEVLGGADCNAKARFDMSELVENAPQQEAPALRLSCINLVDMEMNPGWNAKAFPPLEGNNGVSTLLNDATSQDAPFQEVTYWDVETGNWRSKLADVPIGDFPILPCRGYFIRVAEPTLYRAKPGTVTQDSCNIDLKQGWNFISLSATMPSVNASDACQQIDEAGGQITELARWDAATANWNSYACEQPFGDFVLVPNVPYFIKSALETQWVPKASDAIAASHKKMNLNTGLSAEQNPTITDIRYANINDGSITVIWRTDKPAIGQIRFGNQAGELVNTAHDDRGEAYVGIVHEVTLTSLQPETTYQLEIHSGETIHDNGGLFHQVKTKPTLAIPSIQSGYGQVLDSTGNPIVGAQVYATVSGSASLSAITNAQGYWSLNLGALRTADGTAYLDTATGTLDIEVITSAGITDSQSIAIENLTPAPTLVLENLTPTSIQDRHIYLPFITR